MELSWRRVLMVLGVVLALGTGLRMYQLGYNSFVADEFLDINSSYGYHQTDKWQAWDFNFGQPAEMNQNEARDERASVYKWQVAQLFNLLPPTEAVARSVSVVWGLISIAVVFWSTLIFTRRKEIGLIAALLTAISLSGIIMSRRLRMYAMFFPLYLGAATTLYAFFELEYRGRVTRLRSIWEKYGINLIYLFPAFFLGGLSYLTHQLTPHLGLALFAYLVILAGRSWKNGNKWKNKYGVTASVGMLSILFLVLFMPKVVRMFTSGLVFFDDHYSYFGYAFADFATPLLGLILTLLGLSLLCKKYVLPKEALYLGLMLFIPFLMAIFLWRRNAGPQYIYFIQSFVIILASVGLYGLYEIIRDRFPEWGWRGLWLLVLILALIVPNWGYFFLENNTYHETSSGDNPNYRKVFSYVKKEKLATDILITRNFRNYYWSGAKVSVYDFGGELSTEKLSLAEIQSLMTKYESGWLIYSGNDEDYISSDVERFAEKKLERVSNANVRGDIKVYRWNK